MANISGKKIDRVSAGTWGGKHINLEVTDEGASVEFDCARGSISQAIILDDKGRFDVRGTYEAEGHGPTRQGADSDKVNARYAGSVSGDVMTLTVARPESQGGQNSFTLTQGKQGKLWKCG